MAAAKPAQLIRIARLRRFVGVFARGGDRDAAAEALTELAHVSQRSGYTVDALRRARQAAQLLADSETGEAGVRALIHLASLCLETGALEAAASAAELARERAHDLTDANRDELFAGATLLAGIAFALYEEDDEDELARARLSEARDLLVAAGQPTAAALALVQQGVLDVEAGEPARAELCFAFARDFYRAAGVPIGAVETAAVAARAFAEFAPWEHAERWYITAVGEADAAGADALAAEIVVEHAAELEALGDVDTARRFALDGARRCAMLPRDAHTDELTAHVRLQLARLLAEPKDALRHLEGVFELALSRRDAPRLGAALDVLVSGVVHGRFAPSTWRLVQRFHDHLSTAGFPALAATAAKALADLRT